MQLWNIERAHFFLTSIEVHSAEAFWLAAICMIHRVEFPVRFPVRL